MEVKSVARNTGISASKMRFVVDLVRGKSVTEALTILKFAPTPHARIVAKAVKAAASDAETLHNASIDNLKVLVIHADEATTLRRFQARARGRASPTLKRSSHITVIVGEQEG
jgi:large subunit ribosomal protein L22